MSQVSAPRSIPLLSSVASLARTSDAWICDIWGVLHNGVEPFLPAAAAARAFRQSGGTICLLTNAPRPNGSVIKQMRDIGVPLDVFDAVVTSGDLTRALITQRDDKRLFHLGPPKDLPIFEGLEVEFIGPEAASFVVCSGYYNDDVETPDDYADMLARLRGNDALMVCANPDIMVERGHRLVYCAGALAEAYEKLGGRVIYAGKPHLPAYEMALAEIERARGGIVAKDRILAIGDGMRTDMAGAVNFGVRSLFIGSALHAKGPLDAASLAALFKEVAAKPVGAMDGLVW
jgi:HAD superfamily hydrolase (TIGR01459 family)